MKEKYQQEHRFERAIPPGDNMERSVCTACGYVEYDNPKIVVGSVVTFDKHILLCKRAIEPRKGYWTLPAGYLELNETPEAGAIREAKEEACANIEIDRVLAIYSIPRISQVQIIYRASLAKPEYRSGPESEDVQLFAWDDIPWVDIAFPSAGWALRHYYETKDADRFSPFGNPPEGL